MATVDNGGVAKMVPCTVSCREDGAAEENGEDFSFADVADCCGEVSFALVVGC